MKYKNIQLATSKPFLHCGKKFAFSRSVLRDIEKTVVGTVVLDDFNIEKKLGVVTDTSLNESEGAVYISVDLGNPLTDTCVWVVPGYTELPEGGVRVTSVAVTKRPSQLNLEPVEMCSNR